MGLDMNLSRRTYVKNSPYMEDDRKHTITIKRGKKLRKDIKNERISEIVEDVGYWRKFNALHNWFVQNVQGGVDECKPHFVGIDDLNNLKEILENVLKNKDEAHEILPTTSGFFFGGTDYDEYYFEDVESTLNLINDLIEEHKKSEKDGIFYDYEYRSSW